MWSVGCTSSRIPSRYEGKLWNKQVQLHMNNKIVFFTFGQDDYEGIWNVGAFLLAFICCVFQVNCTLHVNTNVHKLFQTESSHQTPPASPQCHLYLFHSSLKKLKSFTLLGIIILCNLYLLGMRNVWQLLFHISVASLSTILTLTRKLQDRANDCGVWGAVLRHNSFQCKWEWSRRLNLCADFLNEGHDFCVILNNWIMSS